MTPLFSQNLDEEAVFSPGDLMRALRGSLQDFEVAPEVFVTDSHAMLKAFSHELGGRIQSILGLKSWREKDEGPAQWFQGLGPGAPGAAITVELLASLGAKTIWHLGSAGALNPDLGIGDVVIATEAARDEGTSYHYLPAEEVASGSVALALGGQKLCQAAGHKVHLGPIWTTDALFRETASAVRKAQEQGMLAVEMEAATVFAVARKRGLEAVVLRVISDRLSPSEWQPHFTSNEFKTQQVKLHQTLHHYGTIFNNL